MAKFNLENYETVEERLKKFWKDYPNGRVKTEVVHITDDGTCVTIKSSIYKDINDTHPVATGIAQETKGQGGFANADAWMENCETSSLGRSLSNWMYQGANKPRPSKEEMSKVGNSQDNVAKPKDDVAKVTAESIKKLSEDVGVEESVSSALNNFIESFSQDKKVKANAKKTAYEQTVQEGADKDVEKWTENQREMFYAFFEIAVNVSEVLGDVAPVKNNDKIVCDKCNTSQWVEDNSEKKASDPQKFGKIPTLVCSNYGSNQGCGDVIEW